MLQLLRDYFARRRIKGMFGRYLSAKQVARISEGGKNPPLQSAEVELTPFFASVHGYVSYAEAVSLAQLRDTMNAYFEVTTNAITGQDGTLDKYVGDSVIAMFGAPVAQPDHALRGCLAALRCQSGIAALREHFQREPDRWPAVARQLRVRIGLHSGLALVGNLGTATRFNYTMMGDTVNLAARMESVAQTYGTWILCTEATRLACEHTDPGRILFRPLGAAVIKGRAQPVRLFEPVAVRDEASGRLQACIAHFECGLARAREQDWDGAIREFTASAQLEADQPGSSPDIRANPSTVFLTRMQSAKNRPDDPRSFL